MSEFWHVYRAVQIISILTGKQIRDTMFAQLGQVVV